MNENHTLNGLSYISILFAPIVFPVIVWLVSRSQNVRYHAKKALLLQLLPGLTGFVLVGALTSLGVLYNHQTVFSSAVVAAFGTFLLINLVITIYTIVLGAKQFLA